MGILARMANKKDKKKGIDGTSGVIARNRKARFLYEILESFECGIVLNGGEVKSARAGQVQIDNDCYARIEKGEAWLLGAHFAPYEFSTGVATYSSTRPRKLLMHRRQIDELVGKMKQKSLTLVPLTAYFKDGRVKIEIGLARGKAVHDRRRAIAERDVAREVARELSGRRSR